MSNLFINERVMLKDIAIPKYPHLKGIEGQVIDERRLPPFGPHLVTRFSFGKHTEFHYLKEGELSSVEGTQHVAPLCFRAISLWQPWASLIALGEKLYETRSWSTDYRGLLAIHAAKRWTSEEKKTYEAFKFSNNRLRKLDLTLPLGAMLCIVKLVDVHPTDGLRGRISEKERLYGNWHTGRYAWELQVVEVFETPIPAKGAQGFFNWTRPEAA